MIDTNVTSCGSCNAPVTADRAHCRACYRTACDEQDKMKARVTELEALVLDAVRHMDLQPWTAQGLELMQRLIRALPDRMQNFRIVSPVERISAVREMVAAEPPVSIESLRERLDRIEQRLDSLHDD